MRVRKLGLGALAWRGGSLNGGQVGDVPIDVLERYAHKLEILDPMPAPEPVSDLPDCDAILPTLSVSEALERLDAMSADSRLLRHALDAERRGKGRVSLIRALEARLAAG